MQILRRRAKAFYGKHISTVSLSDAEACDIFLAMCSNINREIRVRQYLYSLLLNVIVEKDFFDINKGLEPLRNTIVKFLP